LIADPDLLEAGEVTKIYRHVRERFNQLNFLCVWENTQQTRQIYFNDEAFKRLFNKPLAQRRIFAAIQYEGTGSTSFEKQLPDVLNLRFYRSNLPVLWGKSLELERPYRTILPTVVTHKFTIFNEATKTALNQLFHELAILVE
jgi:hypothetical protein